MLRKTIASYFVCLTAFTAAPLTAAEPPTITVSKSDTLAISLSTISGPEGGIIQKTLQSDLALSGLFNFADANKAGIRITGAATAGALEGKVVDSSGRNILLRSYTGTAREKAHAFANDLIETLTGTRGMAGSKIAFVASRTGRKEIYVADYDGGNIRQLTSDGVISVAPALNTDGSKLAYTSYLKGYADIFLINLASGARDRIIKFPGTNSGASFSPDGGEIACTVSRDGNPELYVVNASGDGARRLTRTPGVESSPSWSPDGGELVYSSDDRGTPQLYRISAGGGSGRLISTGYNYCTEPNWSPDGKRIVFNVREAGTFKVAVVDLASGNSRVVSGAEEARDPVWGPNSRHILYSGGGSLTLLDTQTGRKTKVVDGLGSISEPAWAR
jgi:TolB protein